MGRRGAYCSEAVSLISSFATSFSTSLSPVKWCSFFIYTHIKLIGILRDAANIARASDRTSKNCIWMERAESRCFECGVEVSEPKPSALVRHVNVLFSFLLCFLASSCPMVDMPIGYYYYCNHSYSTLHCVKCVHVSNPWQRCCYCVHGNSAKSK